MSFTALQGTPITVNLPLQAKATGWSIDGDIATHESCNAGSIRLIGYTILTGHTYQISYQVISISGGFVQMFLGDTPGVNRTTTGSFVEEITASGIDPVLYFYSDANCQIRAFNLRDSVTDNSMSQKSTIAYSPVIGKWTSFYTMAPDYGFSMFTRTLLFHYGIMYNQINGSSVRNLFFGVQYNSVLKFVGNLNPTIVKTFEKLGYQANTLLVTTTNGINTSLGQVSNLSDLDFLNYTLIDGLTSVPVYANDGLYQATFLRDSNTDLINGDPLKGNYIIIALTLKNQTDILQLYTVDIKAAKSFNQIR